MALTSFIEKMFKHLPEEGIPALKDNPLVENFGLNAWNNLTEFLKEKIPDVFNDLKDVYNGLTNEYGAEIPDEVIESTANTVLTPDYISARFSNWISGDSIPELPSTELGMNEVETDISSLADENIIEGAQEEAGGILDWIFGLFSD